jgi:branched-chain amino acid transport system ATP-binding protein
MQQRISGHSTVNNPILSVKELQKTFGGITAVDGATFEIGLNMMTGLIGPNGAGKSTTFDLITGFLVADGGSIHFKGEEIGGLKPNEVVDLGLVRTFQSARPLQEMTVRENLALAANQGTGERFSHVVIPYLRKNVLREQEEVHQRVDELLYLFELDHLSGEIAKNLSGGQQKLLALSRALMTNPDILLLDEPFAGVNPTLRNRLIDHLESLRDDGYTILLVEHDMEVVMNHCDHIIVLHQGKVLAQGTPDEIHDDAQVIEAYLGGSV